MLISTNTVNIDNYLSVAKLTPVKNSSGVPAKDINGNPVYYWDAVLTDLMNFSTIMPGADGFHDTGLTIQFNHASYYFKNQLNITRGVTLCGTGSAGENPGTFFVFENLHTAGIKITGLNYALLNATPPLWRSRGAYSILEKISINGPFSPLAINTGTIPVAANNNHGIYMAGTAFIRDCHINSFCGNGIYINATADGVPNSDPNKSDANHWQIDRCYIENCHGNGLHVDSGADVKAGVATSVFCKNNKLWGVWDNSSLNYSTTYNTCVCYANTLGAFKSNSGLFVNCYVEGSQSSEIAPPGTMIGGNCFNIPNIGDTPMRTNNFQFGIARPSYIDSGIGGYSNFEKDLTKPNKGQPIAYSSLGGWEPGVAMALKGSLTPYITKVDPTDGSISPSSKEENMFGADTATEKYAEQQTQVSMLKIAPSGWWQMETAQIVSFAFSSSLAAEGPDQFWLPNGFFVGSAAGGTRVKIVPSDFGIICSDSSAAIPGPLHPGRAHIGDIILNVFPQTFPPLNAADIPNCYAGYICVPDITTPGNQTWAGFGKIEAISGAPSSTPI